LSASDTGGVNTPAQGPLAGIINVNPHFPHPNSPLFSSHIPQRSDGQKVGHYAQHDHYIGEYMGEDPVAIQSFILYSGRE